MYPKLLYVTPEHVGEIKLMYVLNKYFALVGIRRRLLII